ncbi:hypothetical protein [Fibrella aquatica]|uniref:hypothetical protein n=1 Tax=Fibrella aquatica TaxID=3242487 RepID=UPI003520CA58
MRSFLYTLFCFATALIGFQIHHSLFWAIVNLFFAPLSWLKWLLCHEVTVSIICDSFRWFFA